MNAQQLLKRKKNSSNTRPQSSMAMLDCCWGAAPRRKLCYPAGTVNVLPYEPTWPLCFACQAHVSV